MKKGPRHVLGSHQIHMRCLSVYTFSDSQCQEEYVYKSVCSLPEGFTSFPKEYDNVTLDVCKNLCSFDNSESCAGIYYSLTEQRCIVVRETPYSEYCPHSHVVSARRHRCFSEYNVTRVMV